MPTKKPPQVNKRYLEDITGKEPVISFADLLKNGLLSFLPQEIQDYKAELDKADDKGVHSYLCHLEALPKGKSCDVAKGISAREKDRYIGYVQVNNEPPSLMYRINGVIEINPRIKKNALLLPGQKFVGKGLKTSGLAGAVLGQGVNPLKRQGEYNLRSVENDRKRDGVNFEKAVNGEAGQSIGTRAILFNQDGSVTEGADNIRDDDVDDERSADIPSEEVNDGTIPKTYNRSPAYKSRNHPNIKKIAATNDLAGGIAALGGVAALAGIIAMLVPYTLITAAITFMTSIVTLVTNVNNVVNTFLAVADGLLSLFGIKSASKGIKGFLSSMMDNMFGKENVQTAKNAFGSCVNTISTTTKLLEQVQKARSGTDGLVEDVLLRVATVNNSLGESGLIPPEFMATSKAIDELADKKAKENDEFGENLSQITSEIKDQEQVKKELADEKEIADKKKEKDAKDLADINSLLDPVKSDLSKIKLDDL
jgi:hypothetical protein